MTIQGFEVATFAGGCFWCTEVPFRRLQGVEKVISGYTDGHLKNPSYKDICNGDTGHAEAIEIYFDSRYISYAELLEVFFVLHDPTTLNRQGNDRGTQYRSAIYYHSDAQRVAALETINQLEKEKVWDSPIVTVVKPASIFYEAEEYHQNYFERNPEQAYCMAVIPPKLAKLRAKFSAKLK